MLTIMARSSVLAIVTTLFSIPSHTSSPLSHTSISTSVPAAVASRAGIAKYYSRGIFKQVAANRNMAMRLDVDGYAAVPDCSRIGQVVRASLNGRRIERFHVLDCSHPRDIARHLRDGLVIEVDYESARRNGFTGLGRAPAVVYYP